MILNAKNKSPLDVCSDDRIRSLLSEFLNKAHPTPSPHNLNGKGERKKNENAAEMSPHPLYVTQTPPSHNLTRRRPRRQVANHPVTPPSSTTKRRNKAKNSSGSYHSDQSSNSSDENEAMNEREVLRPHPLKPVHLLAERNGDQMKEKEENIEDKEGSSEVTAVEERKEEDTEDIKEEKEIEQEINVVEEGSALQQMEEDTVIDTTSKDEVATNGGVNDTTTQNDSTLTTATLTHSFTATGKQVLASEEQEQNLNITDIQSTTGDIQSTTGDIQSATSDIQSATSDIQSTTGDIQSTTGDIQSTTSDTNPATSDVLMQSKVDDNVDDDHVSLDKSQSMDATHSSVIKPQSSLDIPQSSMDESQSLMDPATQSSVDAHSVSVDETDSFMDNNTQSMDALNDKVMESSQPLDVLCLPHEGHSSLLDDDKTVDKAIVSINDDYSMDSPQESASLLISISLNKLNKTTPTDAKPIPSPDPFTKLPPPPERTGSGDISCEGSGECSVSIVSSLVHRVASIDSISTCSSTDEDKGGGRRGEGKDTNRGFDKEYILQLDEDEDSLSTVVSFSTSLPLVFSSRPSSRSHSPARSLSPVSLDHAPSSATPPLSSLLVTSVKSGGGIRRGRSEEPQVSRGIDRRQQSESKLHSSIKSPPPTISLRVKSPPVSKASLKSPPILSDSSSHMTAG